MVPPGYDAYVLAHVLHDSTDDQALAILRNRRRALPPTGGSDPLFGELR
jgi:hypothetical protein